MRYFILKAGPAAILNKLEVSLESRRRKWVFGKKLQIPDTGVMKKIPTSYELS